MSDASERGKTFEKKIAKVLRKKLGVKVTRDSKSGAGTNKSDINDWLNELPVRLELKDQETIKIKEWFKQAVNATAPNQVPAMAFAMDLEVLVCLRFEDLLDFFIELKDQRAEIDDLRTPVVHMGVDIAKGKDKTVYSVQKSCREGHLSDEYGYCQQIRCKYSRGYRPPKVKR